jgi:peroxiredoxin
MKTDAGKEFVTASQESFAVSVTPSGRLSADGLKPGKYVLSVTIRERSPNRSISISSSPRLASASQEFELKAPEDGKEAAPHDLGKINLTLHRRLKVGDKAPDFSIKTVDGAPLKLSDFKGKFVLLDFWATWCGPCVAELPHLKETFTKHGGNQRFAMIGLSLDSETKAPKEFATKNGVKWIQGFLGDWSKTTLPKDYGVEGIPSLFLIDPDGKIAALDFRGAQIESTVANALQ